VVLAWLERAVEGGKEAPGRVALVRREGLKEGGREGGGGAGVARESDEGREGGAGGGARRVALVRREEGREGRSAWISVRIVSYCI